jgi:hypothetical protein
MRPQFDFRVSFFHRGFGFVSRAGDFQKIHRKVKKTSNHKILCLAESVFFVSTASLDCEVFDCS